KAILYADQVTDSMHRAISETERRRAKQIEFNQRHGITARGVSKAVRELIDGVLAPAQAQPEDSVAPEILADDKLLAREIRRLEKAMTDHARNREVGQAAAAGGAVNRLEQRALLSEACGLLRCANG